MSLDITVIVEIEGQRIDVRIEGERGLADFETIASAARVALARAHAAADAALAVGEQP